MIQLRWLNAVDHLTRVLDTSSILTHSEIPFRESDTWQVRQTNNQQDRHRELGWQSTL